MQNFGGDDCIRFHCNARIIPNYTAHCIVMGNLC